MNELVYLNWDSDLFGLRTGKLNYSFFQDDLIKVLKKDKYKLVYVFVNPYAKELNLQLIHSGGKLVDRKVTFETEIFEGIYTTEINIQEYEKNYVDRYLLDLSFQAGIYSRFKIDNKISNDKFEKLYKEWIKKSVSKEIADNVYIYLDNGLKGMITIKHNVNKSNIGLISVSKDSRGYNIGSKLINKVKSECLKRNIFKVDVITQKDNIPACNFYLKNGFKEINIVNVYHLWL